MVASFGKRLVDWYKINQREMPWRETKDPYRIWVSEIMLQQTRVETVIEYYKRFMKAFPTVESLAKAPLDAVLKQWEGLGYYSRARNLHKCAEDVVENFNGIFPQELKSLKALPGIGPYTAGAVLSIAFGKPYPAVDGNVMRVLARHDGIETDITNSGVRRVFEEAVMEKMTQDPSSFNQGLMELGALVCLPSNPGCGVCPVADTCVALHQGRLEMLPVKTKKVKKTVEKRLFLWIEHRGAILMEKNEEQGLLKGLWTLPNLMIDTFEVTESTASQWMEKHLEIEDAVFEVKGRAKHIFTHKVWEMRLMAIRLSQSLVTPEGFRWIKKDEVGTLARSRAVQKIMEEIE